MDRGQACLLGLGVPGRLKPGLVSPTSKAAPRWLRSLRCQACQDLFSREEGDGRPAPVLARGVGRGSPRKQRATPREAAVPRHLLPERARPEAGFTPHVDVLSSDRS